jgi:hypothetical protein
MNLSDDIAEDVIALAHLMSDKVPPNTPVGVLAMALASLLGATIHASPDNGKRIVLDDCLQIVSQTAAGHQRFMDRVGGHAH